MDKNCDNWREKLKDLRQKHAEFLAEYNKSLEGHNTPAQDQAFDKCKVMMDKMRPTIKELRMNMSPAKRFIEMVDTMEIDTDPEKDAQLKKKLKDMISEDTLWDSVGIYIDFEPPSDVKITPWIIIKKLLALEPEQLINIAKVMEKPTIVIVPNKPVRQIIKVIERESSMGPNSEIIKFPWRDDDAVLENDN